MENTNQAPQLNTDDLKVLRDCLGVAIERGAFKAPEISTVGTVFDRLNAWVNHAAAVLAAQQEESESNDTASDDAQGE